MRELEIQVRIKTISKLIGDLSPEELARVLRLCMGHDNMKRLYVAMQMHIILDENVSADLGKAIQSALLSKFSK